MRRKLLRQLDLLLIDEVSMVRADLLDSIDLALRHGRGSQEPFGGVPVAAFGDFLQLPPVVTQADAGVLAQLRLSEALTPSMLRCAARSTRPLLK